MHPPVHSALVRSLVLAAIACGRAGFGGADAGPDGFRDAARPDGAPGDVDPDTRDAPDACSPGPERCNGVDDDCDGEIDEASPTLCEVGGACDGDRCVHGGEYRWDYVVAGPGPGSYVSPRATRLGPDGTLYIVGSFMGSIDFGGGARTVAPGGPDGFVLALRADGAYAWDRVIAGPAAQSVLAVDVDALGRPFVAGSFQSEVDLGGGARSGGSGAPFVVGLAPDGSYRWDWVPVSVGGMALGRDVTALAGGLELAVVVSASDGVDFGGGLRLGAPASHVVGLDRDGAYLWDTQGAYEALGVAGAPDGGVVVLGELKEPWDFGAGLRDPVYAGEVYLWALDAAHGYAWDRVYSFAVQDHDRAVAVGAGGHVAAVGQFGGVDVSFGGPVRSGASLMGFVLGLGPDGAYAWDRTFESGRLLGPDVAVDARGRVLVGGTLDRPTVDFGGGRRTGAAAPDGFVVRFDVDGTHRWDQLFAAPDRAAVSSVELMDDGRIVVVGWFQGSLDLGGGVRSSGADVGMFVVALLD